jgi:hypothetical protein
MMDAKEIRVPSTPRPGVETELVETMHMAIAPVHKAALGVATGLVAGLIVVAATLFIVVLRPQPEPRLDLLAKSFDGYTVSVGGAAVGFAWAFAVLRPAAGSWASSATSSPPCGSSSCARGQFSRNFLDHI